MACTVAAFRIALAHDLVHHRRLHAGGLELGEGLAGIHGVELLFVAHQHHPGDAERIGDPQQVAGLHGRGERALVDHQHGLREGGAHLDLPLLPARTRSARHRLHQMVGAQLQKAPVVGALLADEDHAHRRLHVVVDAPSADPAEEVEGPFVRLEHHLLALAREDLNQLHAAVAEPHVRRLHLGRHTRQARVLVAPVELVGGPLQTDDRPIDRSVRHLRKQTLVSRPTLNHPVGARSGTLSPIIIVATGRRTAAPRLSSTSRGNVANMRTSKPSLTGSDGRPKHRGTSEVSWMFHVGCRRSFRRRAGISLDLGLARGA